jgi:hypothetical protein
MVGISKSGFNKLSILFDAMLYPNLNRQQRADSMTSAKNDLDFLILVLLSFFCPILLTFFVSTRQCGQGQSARSQMVARVRGTPISAAATAH